MTDPWNLVPVKPLLEGGVAFAYAIAFLVALRQYRALYGEHSILPLQDRLDTGGLSDPLTIFALFPSDRAMQLGAWAGLLLSVLAFVSLFSPFGTVPSMALWFAIWLLFLSFYNAGVVFYEFVLDDLLLIEMGFLTMFLASTATATPVLLVVLFRWTLFRLMFSAGVAKLRGDACWTDRSCFDSHFETLAFPNPLSWFCHNYIPGRVGAVMTVLVLGFELVLPFAYFLPQPFAATAGAITILFNLGIFLSGNYAKINVLTMVLSVSTFTDLWGRDLLAVSGASTAIPGFATSVLVLFVLVIVASYYPMKHLLVGDAGYFRYRNVPVVNTYTLFAGIPTERHELIIEGTNGSLDDDAAWQEYRFYGKPSDVSQRPRQIAPYNYKMEFRMQLEPRMDEPSDWFRQFLRGLLENNDQMLDLVRTNPFPDEPPDHVRARVFRYHYTSPGERADTGDWWIREPITVFQDPLRRPGDDDFDAGRVTETRRSD